MAHAGASGKAQIYDAAVFDHLIGSCDRHEKNVGAQLERKIKLIDNGYTFAAKPENAWNGDFYRLGKMWIGMSRHSPEYAASAKKFADRAFRSKRTIDRLFEEHKLPAVERQSFWSRAQGLRSVGGGGVA